ncbi:cytochrome c biogenesis protein CcsA [Escherichia coli]|nr:cytochrome c biogenesis protein CcsA [Escherichia coli]
MLALGVTGWSALTAGIILGSRWAYCELGWGGWWFWDPVENASLLPRLSATALLHSLSLTRQRGFLPLVAVAGDSYSDAVAAGHLNCPFWHSGFGSCVRAG